MIENYEGKFIDVYGSVVVVVLWMVFVEFFVRVLIKGVVVYLFEVLVILFKKNIGLILG